MTSSNTRIKRSRFAGLSRVIIFNWPLYVFALISICTLCILALSPLLEHRYSFLLLAVACVAFLQILCSLLASHWVYDLSSIGEWSWIGNSSATTADSNGFAKSTDRILMVNAGYDETDGQLFEIFPTSEIITVNLYPSLARLEPSIVRAQKLFPAKVKPVSNEICHWPVADRSIDLLLVAFAAHEVRNHEDRVTLFLEMRRVLADSGRIVLIEHVQDLANFFAYNIGAFHFLKYSDWISCVKEANLRIHNQFKITPFVRVFELCR